MPGHRALHRKQQIEHSARTRPTKQHHSSRQLCSNGCIRRTDQPAHCLTASIGSPAPVSSVPLVAASLAVPASSAPPASLAPPALFPPTAAAATAQQQAAAAAAVPRMPVPLLQGGHEDLARVCLNRLGLNAAVVTILLPFMPLVLAQILPGTTPAEKGAAAAIYHEPPSF